MFRQTNYNASSKGVTVSLRLDRSRDWHSYINRMDLWIVRPGERAGQIHPDGAKHGDLLFTSWHRPDYPGYALQTWVDGPGIGHRRANRGLR